MKKSILFLVLILGFLSCKTNSVTSTKLSTNAQQMLKGNWQITDVTFPKSSTLKVSSFYIADSECFIGSNWTFISNNNKGNLSLNRSNCPMYSSAISWFINTNGEMVLKFLNTANQAKKVRDGYVLQMRNQTPTSFQLVDTANFEGQNIEVVYHFSKNN